MSVLAAPPLRAKRRPFLRLSSLVVGAAATALLTGASVALAEVAELVAPAEPALLSIGSPAPHFTATAHDGQKVDLSKLKGKQVVLYFYPKDDTPGCTKQACEIRDAWSQLQKAGILVFGVSTQDNASHKAFAAKYKLPFPLLPDEDGALAAKYKVPVVNGKARRITYLIGKDGKIKWVWPKVNPVGHAAEILSAAGSK
jgi:thioredoxin-dependent peroxiredoxin